MLKLKLQETADGQGSDVATEEASTFTVEQALEITPEDAANYFDQYVVPFAINVFFAILIYLVGKLVVKGVVGVFGKALAKSKYDDMLINFLKSIVSALLMVFVIIAALNQLGINTTSAAAILAAAGLAIGLALQGSLSNFASGVLLLIFRPFKSGDFIDAAGTMGVVDSIGLFTTTLHTVDNKKVIVPNGAIYDGNITNFSAMDTRRVDMVFGVSYDDDIKKVKQILTEMIIADERVLKDPAPQVALSELADSSVNFVVRPWAKASDYWGLKFDFTEAVKLRFDEEGITIPYPQMDVHTHKGSE